jgi:hypothetical protein
VNAFNAPPNRAKYEAEFYQLKYPERDALIASMDATKHLRRLTEEERAARKAQQDHINRMQASCNRYPDEILL